MNRSKSFRLFGSACVLAGVATAPGAVPASAEIQTARAAHFSTARIRFEQNATDGDFEVVFEAKGGHDGLARLRVVAPDGRTVIDFGAPDASTLGIRQFRMESPEPKDVRALKAAYPEGVYRFAGRTAGGQELSGASTLSHRLPPVVRFATPAPEATGVATKNLRISWRPPAGIARIILELEQDGRGTRIVATLPGDATSFAVPDGFLVPRAEYQLGIGTVSARGNVSFVETTFTTGR